MQATTTLSLSPSFSSYSNGKIAEIAARTVDEFYSDDFDFDERKSSAAQRGDEEEEAEFEFAMTARDSELPSQTSAGDIFQNGKIRPVYSVFNRDSLLGRVKVQNQIEKENSVRDSVAPKIRLPLRKLFHEERETTITTSSSSSSEVTEADGVAAVTYCVWPPKVAAAAEEEDRCKKSSSGRCNSKKWKLKDFLHMSHSDGSENDFVVLKKNEKNCAGTPADNGNMKAVAACNLNGGEKQRSYVRYGHDLVELFGAGNAFTKKLESF